VAQSVSDIELVSFVLKRCAFSYTHDRVAPLLPKDDMFGELARRLFRPRLELARRIDAFRRRHFAGFTVVGVALRGDAAQFGAVLAAINADVNRGADDAWSRVVASDADVDDVAHTDDGVSFARDDGERRRELRAVGAFGDDALVRRARTRLFVVSRDHSAMRSVLREYGNAPQLRYVSHRNFTAPSDDDALMDMWLLSMADAVYTTPAAIDTLGALFSRRPIVVNVDKKRGVHDAQCQPCLSLSGISKARCYRPEMAFPVPPFKCEVSAVDDLGVCVSNAFLA
jgi:hypothetical protein